MSKTKTRDRGSTFTLTANEREAIDELAEILDRSAGDAVRVAVRHAVNGIRALKTDEQTTEANTSPHPSA